MFIDHVQASDRPICTSHVQTIEASLIIVHQLVRTKVHYIIMALSTESPVDFELFTSLRLDALLEESRENEDFNKGVPSPVYMTTHHRDRILEAAKYFKFEAISGALDDESKFGNEIIIQSAKINHKLWPLKVCKPL